MHGYDRNTVKQAVLLARKKAYMSQAKLAERAQLSTKTIRRVEKIGDCHAANLASISAALGLQQTDYGFQSELTPPGVHPESRTPFVIGVMNSKGGVAKTTLCLHLAGILARGGKSVLVLDFAGPLHRLLLKRPPNLPSIKSHSPVDDYYTESWPLRNEFQYVIIDCNASDSGYCSSVLYQADVLLVPTSTYPMDIDATYRAIKTFKHTAPPGLAIVPALVMERKGRWLNSSTMDWVRKVTDDIEYELLCPFAKSRISYKPFFDYLGYSGSPEWNRCIGKPQYTVAGKTIADINDVNCRTALEEFEGLLTELLERSAGSPPGVV